MIMRIIVISHGMVDHKFLESLLHAPSHYLQVAVLCEEPRPAYDRVHLSELFTGKTAEELSPVAPGFFGRDDVVLKPNARATVIDITAKTVTALTGEVLPYDKPILASGSLPFVPPVPGRDRKDCLVYRTIEDLEAMAECGQRAKTGVVIGGGLLGLECTKVLRDMNLQTHVVEFAGHLTAVQVDGGDGHMLRRKIEDLGVTVHTQGSTSEIVDGETAMYRLGFTDGTHLEADMVVLSTGIRPRDELARACGLEVSERGGVVIDSECRTSAPDVYAISECALWGGKVHGLVAPGYEMMRITARRILAANDASEFSGADMSIKLKLMGADVTSLGNAQSVTPGSHSVQFIDERKQIYKKLVVSEDGKYLLGGVLVDDAAEHGTLLQMVLNRIELPEAPEFLILPRAGGNVRPALGMDALPDSMQICSCDDVSKGALCQVVCAGATSVGALKDATKADTPCGGCVPLMTQVMKAEMKKQGLAVNNYTCEHFPYSRQELYHSVRVDRIQSSDVLLGAHGSGMGRDICKPVVASIFASCWNDLVLKKEYASLQGSSDYFLANTQKDGTYPVVSRTPGGEVTADGLIAIGQVVKKYGLYIRITGGQRVDLFGARLEQLPPIWEELIAAGFESGHAYGKSLHAVKSCVGSTWCRYGVGGSVGFAVALENRYEGLRSPHRIRFGVSGCTCECAEAQGKDVGIIATEEGWSLYVCGNGGMKPRHAEPLAADLDRETLIKYVSRFLMFYVRTVDRLQRTSTWRGNLEGGLDYLKDVVISDKLGVVARLEAEIRHMVDIYQDEWKTAVTSPDVRKRFRHFANSEAKDANIVFVEERGQIRPTSVEERAKMRPVRIPVVAEAA